MHHFWPIIKSLVSALRPDGILEIGCETGTTTAKLIGCAPYIYVVDPQPQLPPQLSAHVTLYQEGSINWLSRDHELPSAYQIVLIDGDHNYYTVSTELSLIRERNPIFPIVLLHDAGWPYGDRDMYYNPDDIPIPSRHPYAKKPILRGQEVLSDSGGINACHCNALRSGGPRNGVLTAVNDFLADSSKIGMPLQFILVPAFHGLGILYNAKNWLGDACRPYFQTIRVPDILKLMEDLELDRMEALCQDRRS